MSDDGHWISLSEPVNYTHHGITDVYEDGQFIDIRYIDVQDTLEMH